MKLLFVCTGNICRSPTAHAIARHKSKTINLEKKFIFDSAGVEGFHQGESPDPRSVLIGKQRGISFDGIFSRKIRHSDFTDFDFLLVMDRSHHSRLSRLATPQQQQKIKLFLQFCGAKNPWNDEVIDPYYKDDYAFDQVFDVIDAALERLLVGGDFVR